jgi:hypothetical protein
MRIYRRRDKKLAYDEYLNQSKQLVDQLNSGELSQEEFERAHENLDDKYRFVR